MNKKGMLVASYKNKTVFIRDDINSDHIFFDVYKNGKGVATVTVNRSQWESLAKTKENE